MLRRGCNHDESNSERRSQNKRNADSHGTTPPFFWGGGSFFFAALGPVAKYPAILIPIRMLCRTQNYRRVRLCTVLFPI